MDTIKVLLSVESTDKNASIYASCLSELFQLHNVSSAIEMHTGKFTPSEYDAFIVAGTFSQNLLPENTLMALLEAHVPIFGFDVLCPDSSSSYLKSVFKAFDLFAAHNNSVMYAVNHYTRVFASPANDDQIVFATEMLNVIRQYREFRKLPPRNPQELFDMAERRRKERDFHIAKLLYAKAYETSKNDVILMRLSEAENLLGHTQSAYSGMLQANRNDSSLANKMIKRAFVYDENKFTNASVNNCPLCGGKSVMFSCHWCVYSSSFSDKIDPIRIWHFCPECQHAFAQNPPANLDELTGSDLSFMTPYNPSTNYHFVSNNFAVLLERIRGLTKGNTLLDVGAGQGELALAALEYGYDYTGIEIVPKAAFNVQRLINKRIHCMDFMQFQPAKQYDVIIAGDVIEHVPDPVAFAKKLCSVMHDKSILWLSTPNLFGAYTVLASESDVMPKEVWHLNYFSKQSIGLLLNMAGLESTEYSISRRYLGSMELLCRKKR